jgi:chromosome segregation ATPase
MTIQLEIEIPVYRPDRYEQFERQGRIKLSSVVDAVEEGSLTEGYNRLKKEIDLLAANINARTRLAAEVSELEDQIRWKTQNLKDLLNDIEKAKEHLNTLNTFLTNLGIDPKVHKGRLTIDNKLLLSETGLKVEVSPTIVYESDF